MAARVKPRSPTQHVATAAAMAKYSGEVAADSSHPGFWLRVVAFLIDTVVQVIADQYQAEPGNYLAFFSSFDYQRQASERLAERHPEVPQFAQSRGMSEADRQAFVERFTPHSQGVGFAVLGGAFGEGIDLPGARLIGAFIATLGLPQVNPVNERMRERLQALLGDGWRYTYLYPGLQKVVQAAGRVIRSEEDRGVVWLLDDRFARSEVRRLLPPWWHVETMAGCAAPESA